MSMGETVRMTVPDAVLHQQIDADIVLLHLTTEQYYGLDEVGSRIWQLLKQHGSVDPIVAALVEEYDVNEEVLRSDVERLLSELVDAGLIEVEREPDL